MGAVFSVIVAHLSTLCMFSYSPPGPLPRTRTLATKSYSNSAEAKDLTLAPTLPCGPGQMGLPSCPCDHDCVLLLHQNYVPILQAFRMLEECFSSLNASP